MKRAYRRLLRCVFAGLEEHGRLCGAVICRYGRYCIEFLFLFSISPVLHPSVFHTQVFLEPPTFLAAVKFPYPMVAPSDISSSQAKAQL